MAASQAIATVVAVTGHALARDAAGNTRSLKPGDVLLEGETVITSAGGRVELATLDGALLGIGENQSVAMSGELSAATRAHATEAQIADGSVEQVLQALEQGANLDDVLEAPAAGLSGGDGGDGSSFVRLLRVSEGVDPLQFEYAQAQAQQLGVEYQSTEFGDQPAELSEDEPTPVPQPQPEPDPVIPVPPGPPAVNTPPVAVNDSLTTDQDVALNFGGGTLLSNDSDADGDPLSIVGVGAPGNGTLTDNGDGTYTYTPNAGFSGSDSFTYTISDGQGGTSTATVTVTVNPVVVPPPVNTPPVAVNDSLTTDQDVALNFGGGTLLSNDSDADGDPLSIVGVGAPGNGTLTDNGDGTYTYTPNAGFSGSDSFTYTISDGQGGTSTATVTVTVNPVVVVADVSDVTVTEGDDAVFTVTLSGSTVNAQTFALALADVSAVGGGEDYVSALTNASFSAGVTYDAVSGVITVPVGVSSFTVTVPTVNDSEVEPTETFTLTVGGVAGTGTILDNDLTDANEAVSIAEDTLLEGNLLDNAQTGAGTLTVVDFTVDGGTHAAGQGVVLAGVGTLTIEANGDYSFMPARDYSGPVPQVTYTVSNGMNTDTSTLDITVTPVADLPSVMINLVSTGQVVHAADSSNALSPSGMSITAYKDGGAGTVSIKNTGTPTGFGVAGSASNGAAEEIGNGESLRVELDRPAESVSFQLAWLAGFEYAKYTVHYTDGTSDVVIMNGNSDFGGRDGIGLPIVRTAPAGKLIEAVVFATPSGTDSNVSVQNDYLVHRFSYISAQEHLVSVHVAPTDIQYSEDVVAVVVTAPLGVVLSAGTHDGAGNWTLPLVSDGTYTVSIDPVTKAVTIDGIVLSVPTGVSVATGVSVTATVVDGGDTASGTANLVLGSSGADELLSTSGNDIFYGGLGADVFKWNFGDQGSVASPAVDVVKDFSLADGDALNLRDLLVGENHGNLDDYLSFSYDSGSNTTVLEVKSQGAAMSGADQVIRLEGVNLLDGFADSHQLVQNLLATGKLITD